MKYLRKFESHDNYNQLKQEIEDVLLDLSDDGYNPKVTLSPDYKMHVYVSLLDYNDKPCDWDDLKEYITRVNELTKEYLKPTIVYYKLCQPDGRVFNKGNRDTERWDIFSSKFWEDDTYWPFSYKRGTKEKPLLAFLTLEYISTDSSILPMGWS